MSDDRRLYTLYENKNYNELFSLFGNSFGGDQYKTIDNIDQLFILGCAFLETGAVEHSIFCLEKVCYQQKPKYTKKALYYLGLAYYINGLYDRSKLSLKKSNTAEAKDWYLLLFSEAYYKTSVNEINFRFMQSFKNREIKTFIFHTINSYSYIKGLLGCSNIKKEIDIYIR